MYQKQFDEAFAKEMDFVLIDDISRMFALFSDNSQMDFQSISADLQKPLGIVNTNTIDTNHLKFKNYKEYAISASSIYT